MGVTVNLASGRGTAGDAEGDTLVNIERFLVPVRMIRFIAGAGADHVDGNIDGADNDYGAMATPCPTSCRKKASKVDLGDADTQ